eukprot:TRINITY_DN2198_c0_g1_i1.p2 TRINITY_DN2198_c0_g1~~TRINITY_DN2198_c0_g1_i1.p2  ORF type:complete len:198 (+),score=-11.18 TRINITY_DN2198_c0_g1_i1:548-1141(+)
MCIACIQKCFNEGKKDINQFIIIYLRFQFLQEEKLAISLLQGLNRERNFLQQFLRRKNCNEQFGLSSLRMKFRKAFHPHIKCIQYLMSFIQIYLKVFYAQNLLDNKVLQSCINCCLNCYLLNCLNRWYTQHLYQLVQLLFACWRCSYKFGCLLMTQLSVNLQIQTRKEVQLFTGANTIIGLVVFLFSLQQRMKSWYV